MGVADRLGRRSRSKKKRIQRKRRLEFMGVRVDGIEGAEGVDEGGPGVHGHGYAEGFGNFLLGGASFEGGVGVEGDAAITTSGYGYGDRNELTIFFTAERGFSVGVRENLIAFEGVGRKLGEFWDGLGEIGFICVPIENHNGCSCEEMGAGREYTTREGDLLIGQYTHSTFTKK